MGKIAPVNFMDKTIKVLLEALKAAQEHLEYCGYGDRWERECAKESKLKEKIDHAIELGEQCV